MKHFFKTLFFLSLMLVFQASVKAFESPYSLNDEGFSNRSVIMKSLEKENYVTQSQKDALDENNLAPNVKCLVEQIKKKNYDKVKLLLEAKVNPNAYYNGDYPVYIAAKNNDFEMVQLLVSYNAKLDKGFNSELYQSIKNKNPEMAHFLIENGAKVNYFDSVTGITPLYLAVKNSMPDIAQELIEKGAKVNQKTLILIKKKKYNNLIEKLGN